MSIVAVDFDGTLYQGNTLIPMLKTSKKELTIKQWYSIVVTFFKMALSKENKYEKDLRVIFMRAFFTQMKGKNKKELHSFFMSAIKNGEKGLNEDMLSRIAKHIEQGDRVIIISGTLNPFLETFVEHSNLQADVIGTPLILDGFGTCTGEIGKFNHGAGKIDQLKQWIEQNNAGEETIWAYADSESDLPLLEFADKAVAVNPSGTLKKIAEEKGWEVISQMIDSLLKKDVIPDALIRFGVRQITKRRIHRVKKMDVAQKEDYLMDFVHQRSQGPIAIHTEDANEQHYEMPSEFFDLVLGEHKKYSCAYWEKGDSLDDAEERMLQLVCQRAGIEDGHRILELGCGWGAFCIYTAMRYPHSQVTAVSNSNHQRLYIENIIKLKGIKNLQVMTCDINDLVLTQTFDRVVSIEMFEHMRNYQALFGKIAGFLNQKGKLFVHVFCHCELPFTYEVKNSRDFMARYFFTGGTMPSRDLFHFFNLDLRLSKQWGINGNHYKKTLEAWLKKMDGQKGKIMSILEDREGAEQRVKWWSYWRIFFMACAEFFAMNGGNEYFVAHYLFEKNTNKTELITAP